MNQIIQKPLLKFNKTGSIKNIYFLILLGTLVSCDFKKYIIEFPKFQLKVTEAYSLRPQYEKKPVSNSLLIDNMEHDNGWILSDNSAEYWSIDFEAQKHLPAEMSYTHDRSKDGLRPLRFLTLLCDLLSKDQVMSHHHPSSFQYVHLEFFSVRLDHLRNNFKLI